MLDFSVKEIVEQRKSIRTYDGNPLSNDDKGKINDCISMLENEPCPFKCKVRIKLLEASTADDAVKLGTYGVIRGAKTFLGVAVEKGDDSMQAVGYVFEKLVLFAQSIGLSTCWLGGSFNKTEFAKAMQVKDNEIFPIVSPIGYSADKTHALNKLMRFAIKADKRIPFDDLFFENDFTKSLTVERADKFAFPLEMVRLAPSAGNQQPWRIVKDGNAFHFYEKHGSISTSGAYDIQALDIGIGACHFELALKEMGANGRFEFNQPHPNPTEKTEYHFTCVVE